MATNAGAAEGGPLKDQIYLIPQVMIAGEDDDANLEAHLVPMIGIGGQFTERFALELIGGQGETETRSGPNVDVDTQTLRLDGLYTLDTSSNWLPYLVGGVGRRYYEPDVGGREKSTDLNFGAGFMRSVTDRLSVRGDGRFHFLSDESTIVPSLNIGLRYVIAGPTRPPVPSDTDGDGVIDAQDQCPGTPAGTPVDATGCPLDADNDGVVDPRDACPNTPAGVTVDSRGCPLDGDSDGVADYLDACPDTPRGVVVDARGCTQTVTVSETFRLDVVFDNNSANLRPEAVAELRNFANFLREFPEAEAEIQGHTDGSGTAEYNLRLSQLRAQAVVNFLVDNEGIAANRLTATGYGETRHIATNSTPEGRLANRRVEAVVEGTSTQVRRRD
jgi:OOP family OmpA-OmpF porin